jgi:ABC-2 type transport system permease protein
MNPLSATWEVARWEFRRYFKLRQQIVGALITAVAIAVGMGLGRRDSPRAPADIAVVGPGAAEFVQQDARRLRLTAHDAEDVPALRRAVGAAELHGLLLLNDADAGSSDLVLRRSGAWVGELRNVLHAYASEARLRQEGISPDVLARVLAPAEMELTYHESARPPLSRGERVIFLIAISFVLMALVTGVSYLFASITGEKQIRVTEQVVSAIPAQSWIDGKIIGLAALSLVSVLNTAIVIVLVLAVIGLPANLPLPSVAGDPVAILLILILSLLGFLFWFAFMAAVAALIDDPHTSTRSSLLFLPMVSGGLAFMALADVGSTAVRVLSIAPPTSATMMPARLLLTPVPPLELALSLALLLGAVVLLRLAAGRVFRIAMLMYGKEPSWAEVRRWAFNASPSAPAETAKTGITRPL